jgi:hypothetical protein
MERIAIDTIGPVNEDLGFKFIIVIIDTFSRYGELFSKQEVIAVAAADALHVPVYGTFGDRYGFWFTVCQSTVARIISLGPEYDIVCERI